MSATDDPILIVGPAWIGDMVLAQSLFKALRAERPERRIDCVIKQALAMWRAAMQKVLRLTSV